MSEVSLEETFQCELARLLVSSDPLAALHARCADASCPAPLRDTLSRLSRQATGLRIAALLIARLRFERLLAGSTHAALAFAEDPAAFSATFRRYHHEVAPTAFAPPDEAALFERWTTARHFVTSS